MDANSETRLTRRCRAGEAAAWNQLIEEFSPATYRLAWRMLGNRFDAEDACQEVFVRVHGSFSTYDPTRPLGPWIARITYNVCLKRLGTRAPRNLEEGDLCLPDPDPGPEELVATAQSAMNLDAAMATLSAQDQALLVLRYREGLSDSEVSRSTGMPVNTIKTRLFRARSRLKDLLFPTMGFQPDPAGRR